MMRARREDYTTTTSGGTNDKLKTLFSSIFPDLVQTIEFSLRCNTAISLQSRYIRRSGYHDDKTTSPAPARLIYYILFLLVNISSNTAAAAKNEK